jgi:hypothetical protein
MTTASEIPTAYTPPGGWGDAMPPPILAGCTEPLVEGAPDLRGLWKVVEAEVRGERVTEHPIIGHVERIEQAGDRVVVTTKGLIHDMRCDGTLENGCHDVNGDFTTPIHVIASFIDGVHTLHPQGVGKGLVVTRELDGEQMIWSYLGLFVARCERIEDHRD